MKRFAPATFAKTVLSSAIAVFAIGCLGWPRSSPAAILVVTNQANSGPGTLRTLLPTARNGDVITFAVTGLITNISIGGFVISNNLSIVGPGSNLLTITGTNLLRGFVVNSGATSSIFGLTFYRCNSGIVNSGNLTVSNCLFTGCYLGGGINNSSNLTVLACTFTDCRGRYGASYNPETSPGTSGGSGANGGAIVNSGNLSALNCQFLNNTAGWGGDGAPGQVAIYHVQFTAGGNGGNGGSGGAVYDTGTVAFTNCTFGGNTSGNGGSGGYGASGAPIYYPPTQSYVGPGWNGGYAGNAGDGSAVWSANGGSFVSCTFYNNSTGSGGNGGNGGNAIMPNPDYYHYNGGNGGYAGNAGSGTLYCTGTCQLIACTFYNNSTGSGGSGGNGGSGVNYSGFMGGAGEIGNGANAGNGGSGGAIFGPRNVNTNFTLLNVLVAGNACSYAGSAGSAGARVVSYTGPTGTNGLNAIDGTGPDLSGFFTSCGHNLISLRDGSTGFTNSVRSDLVGSGSAIDAMINGLADNGGPVNTCSLQPGSPALDAGDDTLISSNITTDARGFARKSGSHVDIGAYELAQLFTPVITSVAITGDGATVTVTNTPGVTFTVLGATDLSLPVSNWDVLGQMTETAPGQFQWIDTDYDNYDFRFFTVRSP
jgi:hypothetical protein